MKRIDRLLIGVLTLGIWVLVAIQLFPVKAVSAAQTMNVNVVSMPYETDVQGGPTLFVRCTNCQ